MGLKRLRVRSDFRTLMSRDGRMMIQIICDLQDEEREIILAAADSPHIRDEEVDAAERFVGASIVTVNGSAVQQAEGFLSAIILETLCLSIPSAAEWNKPLVPVEYKKDGEANNIYVEVRHASARDHLSMHADVIGKITFDPRFTPPYKGNPLPNSGFVTRFIAKDDWHVISENIAHAASGERIPLVSSWAERIAIANGYVEESEIAALNHERTGNYRQVFSCMTADGRLYLSTDFEEGAFEVCDKAGNHLGEWLFSGERHHGPDTSGNHNLHL